MIKLWLTGLSFSTNIDGIEDNNDSIADDDDLDALLEEEQEGPLLHIKQVIMDIGHRQQNCQ